MKKNVMMRAASALLVAVLLTTCVISGTFAKYTTSATASDSARVAYWGFKQPTSLTFDLFANTYYNTVTGKDGAKVIAPGTSSNDVEFAFGYTDYKTNEITAPEVDYTFEVSTNGSSCSDTIKNNPNILWKLDNGAYGTWDDLLTAIEALDGNATDNKYKAGNLPEAFKTANTKHTISWKWIFDENATNKETNTSNNDSNDTTMGNAETLANVKLQITITATQID